MKSDVTYVTGLWDIKRSDLQSGFSRSFDHYKECFVKLLKYEHINLVVYCDASLNEFVRSHKKNNIRIINKSLEDLKRFPFAEQVQKIRTDKKWFNQIGWLAESPQAKLEYYNLITFQKQFFLNDTSIFNYFNSSKFFWIDAGLANTVSLDQYFGENNYEDFEKKLCKQSDKMLYVCFPYDGNVEVHGFKKSEMDRYASITTTYVARGGFFGGDRHHIDQINNVYYQLLSSTLNEGLMGTEESIFTLITYRNPELCDVKMIENNGLIYKFFEDTKNQKVSVSASSEIAFYSLVYNTPKQFDMWVKSFQKTYPNDFSKYKKYVINNSTDETAITDYNRLFKLYDFEVIHEGKNIGIQDGRQLCATHFDKTDHDYYVFFEEDFLFADSTDKIQIKDGFIRHVPKLFDNSLKILKANDLDYLKLTMIEFFGNNIYDWSFKNLPKNKKDEFFPIRKDKNEDLRWKTKVEYLGIHNNIAFAVGHFHFCNWPILFSKRGNKQVFLTTVYDHLYEQTMMSQTKMFMMEGKLKVGSLLAVPIYHERKYFYDGKTRRENRHYTN